MIRSAVWSVFLIVFGAALGVAGQFVYNHFTQPPPRTYAKRYITPTNPYLFETFIGRCAARGSWADPERAEAVMCVATEAGRLVRKGYAFDPCFLNTAKDVGNVSGELRRADFLCPPDPWPIEFQDGVERRAVMAVEQRGRRSPAIPHPRGEGYHAWALELANGTRCLRHLPAKAGDPEDLKYVCWHEVNPRSNFIADEPEVGWVVSFPDDSTERWHVDYVTVGREDEGSKPMRVVRAWY